MLRSFLRRDEFQGLLEYLLVQVLVGVLVVAILAIITG
jgi:hypothetical protein